MTALQKRILVTGAGGFIGHHLVRRLKREGFWVRGTDLKFPRFSDTEADDFMIGDLRDPYFVRHVIDRRFDEIYQLAADMGGAGYIFTGEHDADVMHNSASINLNIVKLASGDYSATAKNYPFVLRTNHSWLDEGLYMAVSYVLTTSFFNYSDLKLPEIDQAFKQGITTDTAARKAAYERMQQLWFAQDPMAILARFDQSWAMRDTIVDFTVHETLMPLWWMSSRAK